MAEGITKRRGAYQAWVWSPKDRRKIYKSFPTEGAAKSWRVDALKAVKDKKLRAPTSRTVDQEWTDWLERARVGEIRKRNGERYKPAVLREYSRGMRLRVLPKIGGRRASSIDREQLLTLKEQLLGSGINDSTVTNTFRPLQALYRYLQDHGIPVNPTRDLSLPTGYNRRERIASVDEAAELIDALPESEQALWATAFYAGLRRGELRALRVENINGEIRVEAGWDDIEGEQDPKSAKGKRTVPLPAVLRPYLEAHVERTGKSGRDLVFGSTASHPFTPKNVRRKALSAWAIMSVGNFIKSRSGPEPVTLHEARHTYVTMMHAAGLSLEEIGDYAGHSSAYMTDRYRHLIQGREKDAAASFDAYLARASTASRLKQLAE